MSNPFDYVNAILQNKKQLIVDDITEKGYVPFMVEQEEGKCALYCFLQWFLYT